MSSCDTYEKDSGVGSTWLLKAYLSGLGVVVGLLTMYQSTVGTDAPFPFVVGAVLAAGSAISLVAQRWATH